MMFSIFMDKITEILSDKTDKDPKVTSDLDVWDTGKEATAYWKNPTPETVWRNDTIWKN